MEIGEYFVLLVSLPVNKIHKCFAGNVYKIDKIYKKENSERTYKVQFMAESGESVCAFPSEIEIIG